MIKRQSDIDNLKSIDLVEVKTDFYRRLYGFYHGLSRSQIEYLAGMGAACGATLITYPINKIIFRQSLWGFDFDKAMRQLKIEGITKLYRGSLPPLITKSISASIMFGTFNQYYTFVHDSCKTSHWTATVLAGLAAGTTEACFMPLERIQMLLQDGRLNNRYRNTIHVIVALRRHGIGEYYRGGSAVFLRNGPNTLLYFALKDPIKEAISPSKSHKPAPITDVREFTAVFVSGAILGALLSTISFPLNVVRIHMQTQEVGSERVGLWRTFRRIYTAPEGKAKLVSGIYANAFRSVLYWGCITVFSEALRQYFQEL